MKTQFQICLLVITFISLSFCNAQNDNVKKNKNEHLPEGVTQEWLNSLTEENGNHIVPEETGGDALQQKFFNGFSAGDQYGYSVSSAGDVNGDGFGDIIIGAPYNDGLASDAGRAYIYFGGLNMNTIADVILTGGAINNNFGISVSSAGDVNGDGYSDVIVGASAYSTNTGRAYIYFGGTVMNNVVDVTFTGEAVNNYFGNSVSAAGDVNGDGYSDVTIGAYGNSANKGKAYVYFGGNVMNNIADVIFTGEAVNNNFGVCVSDAGDVNADAYSDVIIGANGFGSNTGRAYIYLGAAVMDNAADVTMTGEAAGNFFGNSVSSAGDLNGDGYSDVAAGALGYSSNTGRVYVYHGGAALNNIADVTITGEAAGNVFGYSVSGAGDMNGDGYSDLFIGAYASSSATGKAYVYNGAVQMDNNFDNVMLGEAAGSVFGYSVSDAGDVNGDGYTDVIAGALGFNSSTGRVYVYTNTMSGEDVPDVVAPGETLQINSGYSVSNAGDVNGDGYADAIVGAYRYNTFTGRAYIYYGGVSMNNVADVILTGAAIHNSFGSSVSGAGDLNGDGYSDVIVGANFEGNSEGKAYIYYGGASMNNVADLVITGEAGALFFGGSVSGAGDVNSDGYSDVLIGCHAFNSFTGRAYIYFGGSSMDNIEDVIMNGDSAYNYFGSSVSDAGDVNNDGYSDVIVGAYGNNVYTGKAYVFYGGAYPNGYPDVTLVQGLYEGFGTSVSGAGDVNGDGYSDVMVSAGYANSNQGYVYIFLGSSAMLNSPFNVFFGEEAYSNFGNSISKAGDVNGDGYSDIVIGARSYMSTFGKTYVYFGGINMNNISDITMKGDSAFTELGTSVSGGGDMNGDGYSDLIVGAVRYNFYMGKTNFYMSSAPSVKPILNFVKDVPADQGGKLFLKWARSSYDILGNNSIPDYYVESSPAPVAGNFAWTPAGTIAATKNPFYSLNVNTPYDSSANTFGIFYYRITARTLNASVFWRSAILSGRSIDNLSPLLVSPFTAMQSSNNVRLNWQRSSAPDLMNYILYRSTSKMIDPETEPVFANTSDSTFLDTAPLSGLNYYFIVAQDIHNNKSPLAIANSPNITVDLTMFIEGFYNNISNTQVSDTVTSYLRNASSPYTIVDSAKAVVLQNGSAFLNFGNASSGIYYIVIKHRNSIETWSKTGGENLARGGTLVYDFTLSASKAFGNNLILKGSKYCIFGGDINNDGYTDLTDINSVYNAASSFTAGYKITDLTGDNVTDLTDLVLTYNNSTNFVSVKRP